MCFRKRNSSSPSTKAIPLPRQMMSCLRDPLRKCHEVVRPVINDLQFCEAKDDEERVVHGNADFLGDALKAFGAVDGSGEARFNVVELELLDELVALPPVGG